MNAPPRHPARENSSQSAGAVLAVRWPVGGTVLLAVFALFVLCGAIEAAFRSPSLEAFLPPGSYGTRSRYLDLHLQRLRQFARSEGGVDCLLLGSSVVFRGVDPAALEDGFFEETGRSLRCFNFGVRGLSPQSSAILAQILREDYAPGLMIVGIDVPGLTGGKADDLWDRFPSSSWARFRQGGADFIGWLIDQSLAFRTYLVYRNWMMADFSAERLRQNDAELSLEIEPSGFGRFEWTAAGVAEPPGADDLQARFFETLRQFEIDPAQAQAIEQVVGLGGPTPIVLFEPPLHPTFLTFFGGGATEYLRGLDFLAATAGEAGVLFIPTTLLELVPNEGWASRNHLNEDGAQVFGRWLGTRIGQAVRDGIIPDPSRPAAEPDPSAWN